MMNALATLALLLPAVPVRESPTSESIVGRVSLRPTAGLIVFEMRVGESEPFLGLLDSGSSGAVLDTELADRIELPRGREYERSGAVQGSRLKVSQAPRVDFAFGEGLSHQARSVTLAPVAPLSRTMLGVDVGAILGHAFFERYVVEVDYADHEMILHDPASYEASESATSVPLVFDPNVAGLPFVDVVLDNGRDDPLTVKMLLDSGGQLYGSGSLGSKAKIDELVPPELPIYETRSATGLGSTPEDSTHAAYAVRFVSMDLGGHAIPRPTIGWTDKSVRFGVMGAQMLKRFTAVYDYRRSRLLLEPNRNFSAPVPGEASGLVVLAGADDTRARRIFYVTPGTPAEEAGLEAGDELLELQGRNAPEIELLELREILRKPGEYALRVRREGEVHDFLLKTRELL